MDALKRQARARRRAERRDQRTASRAQARKRRRCFWTWPLGHEYVDFGTDEQPDLRCVACDAPSPATNGGGHVPVRRGA